MQERTRITAGDTSSTRERVTYRGRHHEQRRLIRRLAEAIRAERAGVDIDAPIPYTLTIQAERSC